MWAPSIVVISDVDRMTRDMAGLLVDKVHEMQRNCSPILMICTATDVTAVRQNVKDLCFEVKLQVISIAKILLTITLHSFLNLGFLSLHESIVM